MDFGIGVQALRDSRIWKFLKIEDFTTMIIVEDLIGLGLEGDSRVGPVDFQDSEAGLVVISCASKDTEYPTSCSDPGTKPDANYKQHGHCGAWYWNKWPPHMDPRVVPVSLSMRAPSPSVTPVLETALSGKLG
ncbi:hypothetical protein RUND412_002526 [Rhizina undulata]